MTGAHGKALKELFRMRGVVDFCKKCGGLGTYVYKSTSTWSGGIGGQPLTTEACDKCWGSGDENKRWPSHREFFAMKRAQQEMKDGKKGSP